MLKTFIHSESGAVTVDYVVILGGVISIAMLIVGDVAQATMNLTDRVVERASYESIIAAGSVGNGSADNGNGNPGNDKNVGNAGENPDGKGGWGNGSKGRSE